jgi:ATP-binding cassette subfamily B protein
MVIDKGGIMEKGNHESLVKSEGVYHDMYFGQFKNLSAE